MQISIIARLCGSFLCGLVTAWTAPTILAADSQQLFKSLDTNEDRLLKASEFGPQHSRLLQRLIRTSDADRNGQLTLEEFHQGLQSKRPEKPLTAKRGNQIRGANALLLLLSKMDVNGDLTLETDEIPEQYRGVFNQLEERLGGEKDGRIHPRELQRTGPQLARIAARIVERMDLDVELELALLPEKKWLALQSMDGPPRATQMLGDEKETLDYFRRMDTNGDGQVSPEEVPEGIADRFERLLAAADRDGNDQLSEQEFSVITKQRREMQSRRPPQAEIEAGISRLLKELDHDGDQQVSREEAPRRLKKRFSQVDLDGDGQLNRDELSPVVELLSRIRKSTNARPGLDSKPVRPRKD